MQFLKPVLSLFLGFALICVLAHSNPCYAFQWKIGDPDFSDLDPELKETIKKYYMKGLLVLHNEYVYFLHIRHCTSIPIWLTPLLPQNSVPEVTLFQQTNKNTLTEISQQEADTLVFAKPLNLKTGSFSRINREVLRKIIEDRVKEKKRLVVNGNYIYQPSGVNFSIEEIQGALQLAIAEHDQLPNSFNVLWAAVLPANNEGEPLTFTPELVPAPLENPPQALQQQWPTPGATNAPLQAQMDASNMQPSLPSMPATPVVPAMDHPGAAAYIATLVNLNYVVVYGNNVYIPQAMQSHDFNLSMYTYFIPLLNQFYSEHYYPNHLFALHYDPNFGFTWMLHQIPVAPPLEATTVYANTAATLETSDVQQAQPIQQQATAQQAQNPGVQDNNQIQVTITFGGQVLQTIPLAIDPNRLGDITTTLTTNPPETAPTITELEDQNLITPLLVYSEPAETEDNKIEITPAQQTTSPASTASPLLPSPAAGGSLRAQMPTLDAYEGPEDTAQEPLVVQDQTLLPPSLLLPSNRRSAFTEGASGQCDGASPMIIINNNVVHFKQVNVLVKTSSNGPDDEDKDDPNKKKRKASDDHSDNSSGNHSNKSSGDDQAAHKPRRPTHGRSQPPKKSQPSNTENKEPTSQKSQLEPADSEKAPRHNPSSTKKPELSASGQLLRWAPAPIAALAAITYWYWASQEKPKEKLQVTQTPPKTVPTAPSPSSTPSPEPVHQTTKIPHDDRSIAERRADNLKALLMPDTPDAIHSLIDDLFEFDATLFMPTFYQNGKQFPASFYKEILHKQQAKYFATLGKRVSLIPALKRKNFRSLKDTEQLSLIKKTQSHIIKIHQETGLAPLEAFNWLNLLCGNYDSELSKLSCYHRAVDLLTQKDWRQSQQALALYNSYLRFSISDNKERWLLIATWPIESSVRLSKQPLLIPAVYNRGRLTLVTPKSSHSRTGLILLAYIGFLKREGLEFLTTEQRWRKLDSWDLLPIANQHNGASSVDEALLYDDIAMRKQRKPGGYAYGVLINKVPIAVDGDIASLVISDDIHIDCDLHNDEARTLCTELLDGHPLAQMFCSIMKTTPELEIPMYQRWHADSPADQHVALTGSKKPLNPEESSPSEAIHTYIVKKNPAPLSAIQTGSPKNITGAHCRHSKR